MAIENLFTQWENMGIFSFALPFLLIFAIVFGILMKTNIFGTKDVPNKKINAIIALVVSLIALQFNIVSSFFSELFPRFGIALAVILIILMSIGFFADLEKKRTRWILGGIILIAIIAVLFVPLKNLGITIDLNGFFERNFGWIFFVLLILGLIIWAVAGGSSKEKEGEKEKKGSESSSQEEK